MSLAMTVTNWVDPMRWGLERNKEWLSQSNVALKSVYSLCILKSVSNWYPSENPGCAKMHNSSKSVFTDHCGTKPWERVKNGSETLSFGTQPVQAF